MIEVESGGSGHVSASDPPTRRSTTSRNSWSICEYQYMPPQRNARLTRLAVPEIMSFPPNAHCGSSHIGLTPLRKKWKLESSAILNIPSPPPFRMGCQRGSIIRFFEVAIRRRRAFHPPMRSSRSDALKSVNRPVEYCSAVATGEAVLRACRNFSDVSEK